MAAPARIEPPVPSDPAAEPSAGPESPHLCVFSAEGFCAEAPLTSEPPLPDAEPLTSEPPLADPGPPAGRSDASLDPSGLLPSVPDQFRPER
ncbi:hypothetical protein [Streptomyces sp. NPDC052701]|uniref:hypothetical protein n=1 Tax=Streptomyces sp. NPDC052701 TaxID=3155533 RepID=UPI0034307C04